VHIGLVGLGKMGGNMRSRLRNAGIEVTGFDRNADLSDAGTLADLVADLPVPRVVWIMVPAGDPTTATVNELADLLGPGDLVIEGGNSRFTDDTVNAATLAAHGIGYLDCGVSGGIWGLQNGYGLMVGGDQALVDLAMPVFDALRPEGPRAEGFVHAGSVGAGHYAKMVHNGIEYGLMQAYAEGFELLKAKQDFALDLAQVAELWRHGSVVRSWLLDLTASALAEDQELSGIRPWVSDSGEGRWTVNEAIDLDVPAPVITLSLMMRFASRQENSYAARLLAAMRNKFGGHAVLDAGPDGA
jgi:6-phosphogluconate dehydrogenase